MRHFFCSHCHQLVFFDSSHCLGCGKRLAFCPERERMLALDPVDEHLQVWAPSYGVGEQPPAQAPARYRLCVNATQWQACNLAIPADAPHTLCAACQHSRMIPFLGDAGNRERWRKLESAKRQFLYGLVQLGLMRWSDPADARHCPLFHFLADLPGQPRILTGHLNGTITVALCEADDDERVRRRIAMHEPYRTVLGHLRHESGHFYWDRLIAPFPARLQQFRTLFGDERLDYEAALQRHYQEGAPAQWWDAHVSAYASAHPWEDFAETWAHYLHVVDTLETAHSYQLGMGVQWQADGSATRMAQVDTPLPPQATPFEAMMSQWTALSMMLNSLNRSLGHEDAYPFALSGGALRKLRFVHQLLCQPSPLDGDTAAP